VFLCTTYGSFIFLVLLLYNGICCLPSPLFFLSPVICLTAIPACILRSTISFLPGFCGLLPFVSIWTCTNFVCSTVPRGRTTTAFRIPFLHFPTTCLPPTRRFAVRLMDARRHCPPRHHLPAGLGLTPCGLATACLPPACHDTCRTACAHRTAGGAVFQAPRRTTRQELFACAFCRLEVPPQGGFLL